MANITNALNEELERCRSDLATLRSTCPENPRYRAKVRADFGEMWRSKTARGVRFFLIAEGDEQERARVEAEGASFHRYVGPPVAELATLRPALFAKIKAFEAWTKANRDQVRPLVKKIARLKDMKNLWFQNGYEGE